MLRADSGFCREALMAWCEQKENRVEYVFGLQRNRRLQTIIGEPMQEVKKQTSGHRQSQPHVYRVPVSNA